MNKCTMFASLFAGALAIVATAATAASPTGEGSNPRLLDPGVNRLLPVVGWKVDAAAGIERLNTLAASGGRVGTKAATDFATVFRPVTPCRLVDTRGNGAPIQGGAFAPATRRTMLTAGNCGIPTSFVRGISMTVVTFNLTPATGGFISVLAPGAAISGTNDIFNFGSQWSGTSVNAPTNTAGSFDVYVDQATAHVIIDVNGYYQDLNELDVNTEMDIFGTTPGDLLRIGQLQSNSTALRLDAAGATGTALDIGSGAVRASGAGVNTSTFSFIHQINTADYPTGTRCSAGFPNYSVIDHPLLNGNSGAIIQVTLRRNTTTQVDPASGAPIVAYCPVGCGCAAAGADDNKWLLYTGSASAVVNTSQYNMLVILP